MFLFTTFKSIVMYVQKNYTCAKYTDEITWTWSEITASCEDKEWRRQRK